MMRKTSDLRRNKPTTSNRINSAIDNFVGFFSPRAKLRRIVYRRAVEMASGAYKGARSNRLNAGWLTSLGSADEDLLGDLNRLRERSRDLNRNDAFAAGVTSTVTTNTVGTGIRPQSRIDAMMLDLDETTAKNLKRSCERVFEKWMPHADAGNRMDFFEIQRLADRQILESGEALFLLTMVQEPGRPYFLALDPIEPDRLDTPTGLSKDFKIRKGVELGERGEPIAYWIKKTHPGDFTYGQGNRDDYERIPAVNQFGRKNVLHLFEVQRPGQTRGVPFFAPVMDYFKQLADYLDAELVAARVAACIALLVETDSAVDSAAYASDEDDSDGKRLQGLSPGMIHHLQVGQKVTAFNPSRPAAPFDPFVMRILRAISTGLNLPYEIVAKDFSRSNYSNMRGALLQAYRYFKQRQIFLSTKLNHPVWCHLMEEAWLRGHLSFPDFYANYFEYTRALWVTPGWQWVDPMKEAEAAVLSIEKGLSNLSNECASRGDDYEEIMIQRARELHLKRELEAEFGISFESKVAMKPTKDYTSDKEEADPEKKGDTDGE